MGPETVIQSFQTRFLSICLVLGSISTAWSTNAHGNQDALTPSRSHAPQVEEILHPAQDPFCAYDGGLIEGKLFGFPPSKQMERFLSEVSSYGPPLKVRLRLLSSNVANAAAFSTKGESFILINQQFMDKIADDSRTWYSVKAILAHEVAHHLYGHTLSQSPPSTRHKEELQADFYSGMVLKQMGATLDETLAAVTQIDLPGGSTTHPPRAAREAAVESGYKRPEDLMTMHTSMVKKEGLFSDSSFYSRVSLKDDPQGEYYVAGDEELLKVTPEGKVLMLGYAHKLEGEYTFEYEIADKTYAVDKSGFIWKEFHGIPVRQGRVDAMVLK